MQPLTGSVGDAGKNALHEVALVKFLLTVAKRPSGGSYLPSGDYTNVKDVGISGAIRAFQQDHQLVAATPGKPRPGVSKPETAGLLEPGSATWTKLVAAAPVSYSSVRTTEGVALVYFPMSASALATAKGEIQTSELQGDFKHRVTDLLEKFYAKSGIAVSANPDGLRRSFAQQMNKSSEASPGETIHNYGYAVDLGFTGLSYVTRTGATQTVDRTDRGFDKWPRIKEQIFAARNAIALRQLSMFATTALGGGDYFHLQNFEDKRLDSVSSFMKLLTKVGPMKMKWRPEYKTWTDYWCDLGLGGEQYYVGASVDIWVDTKPLKVSKEDLAKALSAKMKVDPKFSPDKYLVRAPKPPTGGAPGKDASLSVAAADITDQDIAKVKALLKAAGAAEEDEANEAAGAVEAVGASREGANLAVEAFRWPVAETGSDEGEDAVEVTADRLRELLEGRQARTRRPATPGQELFPRHANLLPAEDLGERLLEQIRAVQRPIRALDRRELVAVDGREIPRILSSAQPVFFSDAAPSEPASTRTCSRRT